MLTLIASQADQNAVDLAATRCCSGSIAACLRPSWLLSAGLGSLRRAWPCQLRWLPYLLPPRLWIEALLVLGSQGASLVTIGLRTSCTGRARHLILSVS